MPVAGEHACSTPFNVCSIRMVIGKRYATDSVWNCVLAAQLKHNSDAAPLSYEA